MTTASSLVGVLSRGDIVIVNGESFTVHETDLFDATSVPLSSSIYGSSGSNLPVYLGGATTGTHTVKYTPVVKGTYQLDVVLPNINEVQTISTTATSSIGGSFVLTIENEDGIEVSTSPLSYASTPADVETESRLLVGDVTVSDSTPLDAAYGSQVWSVTFVDYLGDVPTMIAESMLSGNAAKITVEETLAGLTSRHIVGSLSQSTLQQDPHTQAKRTHTAVDLWKALLERRLSL